MMKNLSQVGGQQRGTTNAEWCGRGRMTCLTLASVAGLMLAAGPAFSQPPRQGPATGLTPPTGKPAPTPTVPVRPAAVAAPVATVDNPFPVSGFVPGYADAIRDHPGLPSVPDLMSEARVALVGTPGGFDTPSMGATAPTYSLSEIGALLEKDGPKVFSRRALEAVLGGVRDALNARGIVGVWIEYDREQVEVTVTPGVDGPDFSQWSDRRGAAEQTLTITVNVATVAQVRTVASGDRIEMTDRVDSSEQVRVARNSPVKPSAGDLVNRSDLLNKPQLDDYVLRLNRRAGRRVDVAVAPGEEPGTAVLDYLIRENDPLTIYLQGSNTGTQQTEEWRVRFGLIHSQLTNNDDQLSLDYVTGGFESYHNLTAAYEFPIFDMDTLRLKIHGNYNEFDASDVGSGSGFTGSGYYVGTDLIWNFLQVREWFFDAVAGVRFQHVDVDNQVVNTRGESDFFFPRLGLNIERNTQTASTYLFSSIEFNAADIADTPENLDSLGRTGTTRDFTIFQGSLEQTFYLEPIFDSAAFNAGTSTLAHEAAFIIRGQTAFNDRVVPSFQGVAGGFYSVRGYEESESSGDSLVLFTAEYRLHLPRLFEPTTDTTDFFGEFRYAPEAGIPYSRPDWDLILRAFVDVGQVYNNDRLSFERDDTLIGLGGGVELQVRRNLNVRVDVGVAAEDTQATQSGDVRVHFVGTLLF
ncbi:MAG: hypothetical protein ACKVS8_12315 [Phycisphaerales bacterium]